MDELKGKVAVITGAASGIGRSLAGQCAQRGMKIVLADVEEKALYQVEHEFKVAGADATAVLTDVSEPSDVSSLAGKTMDTYGGADLLFNNAGVAAGASIWESSINDCRWVMGVNLWGVIHCIREFVPLMMRRKTRCHIINTSSVAGLSTYHPSALYQLTKHGIVALSEQLCHDLEIRGADIDVSVICPGMVNTKIMDAGRNRPRRYWDDPTGGGENAEPDEMQKVFREMVMAGMSPSKLAEIVFKAIKENKFYIFPHPEMKSLAQLRMEGIMEERAPVLPPMPGT